MLLTDTNLRTEFGAVSSGYFLPWDVVLVTALADLVGAVLLRAVPSRRAIAAGVVGSGWLALVFVGDLFTYRSVGFATATGFAQYLFGITYHGGDVRYLYDLVLVVYLAAFVFGAAALARTRSPVPPTGGSDPGPP